ncbi:MAG: LamG-like jellyroll fold domain-containing protein [bacterium]
MKGLVKVLFAQLALCLFFTGAAFAQAKRTPDAAYDPTNNRYLMVWEEDVSGGSNIVAQFRNPDGTVGAGAPTLISDPRPTQGCFYGQFDAQNGDITTPTNCPQNKNPSVAYNNGQYLVVWEVHGTAASPASAPDNEFVNIFAQVINANTLEPLPGWEEGILISKVFIAANNAESSCGDRHACNDGQIQAWSKSINPDVAPRVGGQGFVVTWQTNRDYIGCADPERRRAWSVYGRYIDQNFSATSTTNPPAFAVFKDDSTMAENCEAPSNVDNGVNPRIAVNQTSNDFVVAYEVARASGSNASIGAKRVTLDGSNVGQVTGSIMPGIVANVSGASLNNPEIVSFKNRYVLFASDGSNIRAKSFDSSTISASEPAVIALGGGSKINPRASSNLGIGGQRSGTNPSPERMAVAYENGGNVFAVILNEALAVTRGPENISTGMGTSNQAVELSSDVHNFLAVWGGQQSGEQVFAEFISANDGGSPTPTPNVAPTAPGLLAPNDMVTFAPTRAYLNWNASTDSDGGTITYRIYFGENVIPATPQVSGVTSTHYVIGPETQSVTGITLLPNKTYKWKVEASDGQGGFTSSPVRTLMTDNSVVGWWRFDENPAGAVCAGGGVGETICDYSGNNNHAVPLGLPTWLPPPMVGVLGGALDFDGINDYVNIDNAPVLNFSSPQWIGIEIKFNPQTFPAQSPWLVGKGTGPGNHGNYSVILDSPTHAVRFSFSHASMAILPTFVTSQMATLGVWNHAIINHRFGDGTTTKVKLNGVNAPGVWKNADETLGPTGSEPPLNSSSSLAFGRRSTSAESFYDGSVDEIIVFNKSLDDNYMYNEYLSSIN